jgi:hypothetical protein
MKTKDYKNASDKLKYFAMFFRNINNGLKYNNNPMTSRISFAVENLNKLK